MVGGGLVIGVIPQVAVQQVLVALRLKAVVVVRHGLLQDGFERKHLGQVGQQPAGFGIRKPDAVVEPIP